MNRIIIYPKTEAEISELKELLTEMNLEFKLDIQKKPETDDEIMNRIMDLTCEICHENKNLVMSKCRKTELAFTRMIFMYIVRSRYPHIKYKAIGLYLGGRDHSTIINGFNIIKDAVDGAFKHVESNRLISQKIDLILKNI